MNKLARLVFIVLVIGAFVMPIRYYSQLPETVSSHFNGQGYPDDAMGKVGFFSIYYVVMAFLVGLFLGCKYLMLYIPSTMMNLPNKGYWLAKERRAETCQVLAEIMLWLGSGTIGFLLYIFYESIQVNLGRIEHLRYMTEVLIGYFVYTLGWVGWIFWRFRKPKNIHHEEVK